MRNTLVGDEDHVGRIEELDNCLDGKIGAGKWWSEEHHGLSYRELLSLGHLGARSLKAGAKYDTTVTPSPSLAAGGGEKEDAGSSSDDESRGGRQVRLQQRSLALRRRAKVPGWRKWRWSRPEKASGRRVVGNAATAVRVGKCRCLFF